MKKTYGIEVDCANCAAKWRMPLIKQQAFQMQPFHL